jgi:hypothetical protein
VSVSELIHRHFRVLNSAYCALICSLSELGLPLDIRAVVSTVVCSEGLSTLISLSKGFAATNTIVRSQSASVSCLQLIAFAVAVEISLDWLGKERYCDDTEGECYSR